VPRGDRHRRFVVGIQARELVEDLLGDEDRLEARLGRGVLDLDEGEAVAVGGRHLETAVLRLQERALQLEPDLLGGDGEADLLDHPAERAELQGEGRAAGGLRTGREVGGRQTVEADPELWRLAVDLDVVVLEDAQADLGSRRKVANDVEEFPRRYGDGSARLEREGLYLGDEGRIEIGRRERERCVAGLEEDVREDLMRRPPLHHTLHQAHLSGQGGCRKCQLHIPSNDLLNSST
jgi:hypothetical protein